eukprot:Em0010g102a
MNFEWNKSNFSRNFKHAKDATTFVKVWREVTEADDNGFERARKEQEYSSDHEDASESDGGLSKSVVTPSLATPPAKKLKVDYEKNSLDTAIQQKKIGLVKIDIRRLREPPPSRQLRKLDLTFVDALASKMTEDPFGPGVPPMAVVCTSVKSVEEFKMDFALHYAYEVHGGSHSYAARLKLLAIHPDDEQFLYALSDVYVALSDAECLRLAARHNINGHFHCEMSHRDYGMSRTSKENLFCQAAFPRSVWELAVKVMNMFENGEIKNQKLSKKNLCSTPRMKQNHFVPLHHLDTSFQESALEKVLCKELSLNELKIHCQTYRALVEVRKNFMKCTNSDTWEEVERRFGTYAEEKRLMQFVTLPFTNGIPQVFKDYCQAALTMTTTESSDCFMVHQNDARGYVICADPMMVTAADIKRTVNVFQGANLIIAQIPQDLPAEKMELLSFTSRQINSLNASLALFNFAVVCDPEQIPAVERALKKCYDHISRLYAYNKAEPVHPGIGLVPSVTAVIVGHWAQDGKLSPEHFQSRAHNAIVYGGTAEELLRTVITLFSYEGQWVIDLLGTAGAGVLVALQLRRNAISTQLSQEQALQTKQKLVALVADTPSVAN